MDEDEYLTPEQLQEILDTKYVFDYFVYFDKDNGDIIAISNEQYPYENFIQVEFADIERFFNKDNFINFRVTFDEDGALKFVNKNQSELNFKSNIVETIRLNEHDNVLTVEWSNTGWKFIINDRFLTHPRAKSLNAKLYFYVTREDNINILIRTIEIQLRNLLSNKTLVLPFETENEKAIDNISMFTLPFFETYGMRIKHD
jgi:hypothetical protein